MLCSHIHGFADRSALNRGNLGLVVGISDIYMDVRNDKNSPLLGGIDRLLVEFLPAADLDNQLSLSCGVELGDRELDPLLAKIVIVMRLGLIGLSGDLESDFASRFYPPRMIKKCLHSLQQFAVLPLVKD